MALQQKFLEDGSFTLFEAEVGEHYHNRVGAYTESLEQYTRLALAYWKEQPGGVPSHVRLWDVCFGLGYNTFTFIHHAAQQQVETGTFPIQEIHVQAVELDEQIMAIWPQVLQLDVYPLFQPGQGYEISVEATAITFNPVAGSGLPKACIHLRMGDALVVLPQWQQNVTSENTPVHAIFHDAFSPRKVPHLWQASIFKTYADVLCLQHGVVLTYSVARVVKDGLEQAGLSWKKTEALHSLGHKKGGLMGVHPKGDALL
jgi:tRNA U34 5-methylaminomethyl-2-thiouridine-forming methyltransferase MnmC